MYEHKPMSGFELAAIGENLFGERWKSALGRELGYSYQQIRQYAQGKVSVPRCVALAIRGLQSGWYTA